MSIIERVIAKYREQGLKGVRLAVAHRRMVAANYLSTEWSRNRLARHIILQSTSLLEPPVLILSLPRSGSTWVGDILGAAPNACYLFEPMNTRHREHGGTGAVFQLADADLPNTYRESAYRAFRGIPNFSPLVVRRPFQWNPVLRHRRRVVVKEVNPYAAEWLLAKFQPRLIFLIRHPLAVYLSHRKLGWCGNTVEEWRELNARYCETLKESWSAISAYPNRLVVEYEKLTKQPERTFRELSEFALLKWTDEVRELVRKHGSKRENDDSPFSTYRDTSSKDYSWQKEVTEDFKTIIREDYLEYRLPWYQDKNEWM